MMEGEEIRLKVLIAADGNICYVKLAQIELHSRAENRRPEVRDLKRIGSNFKPTKGLIEWQKDERVQTLEAVARQIQFGDADIDEGGGIYRHHPIPRQR